MPIVDTDNEFKSEEFSEILTRDAVTYVSYCVDDAMINPSIHILYVNGTHGLIVYYVTIVKKNKKINISNQSIPNTKSIKILICVWPIVITRMTTVTLIMHDMKEYMFYVIYTTGCEYIFFELLRSLNILTMTLALHLSTELSYLSRWWYNNVSRGWGCEWVSIYVLAS